MRNIVAALLILLGLTGAASAQTRIQMPPPAGVGIVGFQVVTACGAGSLTNGWLVYGTVDLTGKLCTNATGGGGGGGTSSTDASTFTLGTTAITPSGGIFSDAATLSAGQVGAPRYTTKRAQIVDVDTAGNALYSAITAPIPAGTNLIGDVNLRQGGTALSTTNGIYANQLQGNAVLSATNPSFARLTDGTNAVVTDPCQGTLTSTPISISTAATSVIVAGTAAKKTYICGMMLFSAGTTNVGIVQGSGATCGTSTLGLIGGATAATGPNLTAQAGFASPPAGYQIAATTVNQNDICLINGSAIQVSGFIVTAVR